ncbi:hypothetical protein GGS23DRAFT_136254 [Durotheca rogersii]|uniref:uncharacterized protein n=1 Tax=Durotheca rogersii TaxID=419775 RepID=UPI00221F2C05|nr:uncharacterized protein GGS23DRAFT_136254 [Durotheca rogersii]KAI5861487.1 hypothetical protein GGS23DRAFT_136254 [Durotheca rogersii]
MGGACSRCLLCFVSQLRLARCVRHWCCSFPSVSSTAITPKQGPWRVGKCDWRLVGGTDSVLLGFHVLCLPKGQYVMMTTLISRP